MLNRNFETTEITDFIAELDNQIFEIDDINGDLAEPDVYIISTDICDIDIYENLDGGYTLRFCDNDEEYDFDNDLKNVSKIIEIIKKKLSVQ